MDKTTILHLFSGQSARSITTKGLSCHFYCRPACKATCRYFVCSVV